jgi:hypothetical protein
MPANTTSERLEDAVEALLGGAQPHIEPALRPLLDAAGLTADALPPIPAGPQFEALLAARLAREGLLRRAADAVSALARRELAHRGRLIAAGAVSTAAVGFTVTALAMRRSGRHHPPVSRLLVR